MLSLSVLHVLQLLLLTVVFVSGCFITNCPPGGKRSDSQEKTHQCGVCGPPGLGGRCYGSQICCSPQFGCMIGGPISDTCRQENHSPTLCHNPSASCDGSSETGPVNGQCAAHGICCTPETCTMDEDCIGEKGHHHRHMKPIMVQHVGEEPEGVVVPLMHGSPADAWFYRRLIHSSKGKQLLNSDGLSSAEPEMGSMPQGPPSYFPGGPPRLADYF